MSKRDKRMDRVLRSMRSKGLHQTLERFGKAVVRETMPVMFLGHDSKRHNRKKRHKQ